TSLFVATRLFQFTGVSHETCMVTELKPAGGRIEKRNLCPRRRGTRDLFKVCRSSIKAPCKIMRLGRQEIDLGQQRWRGAKRPRIVQNCNRFIEMFIFHFELRKLEQSRGNRLRL